MYFFYSTTPTFYLIRGRHSIDEQGAAEAAPSMEGKHPQRRAAFIGITLNIIKKGKKKKGCKLNKVIKQINYNYDQRISP